MAITFLRGCEDFVKLKQNGKIPWKTKGSGPEEFRDGPGNPLVARILYPRKSDRRS
jgi:hypothetical protein